ncbi:MAG: urease accessory UreF family protein [Pseudomonadota bacterium]
MSTDTRSLHLLLSWLSPSFPVGAYAFSHGLEYAVAEYGIDTPAALTRWLQHLLHHGSAQTDLVFAAAAWAADDPQAIHALCAQALAFSPSAEIKLESTAQAEAFVHTIASAWPCHAVDELRPLLPDLCAYPVAVARVARAHSIEQSALVAALAHAFCANLVSAAIRLVPLGQTDGQRVMADLLEAIDQAATHAMATPVDAVATQTLMSDIASMKHEHQYTRLFRS